MGTVIGDLQLIDNRLTGEKTRFIYMYTKELPVIKNLSNSLSKGLYMST